jgi:UDP-N-acetylmuramoyl-L-alanyl-D-glutamate--2,6-diaminopimelate ligase
MIEYINTDSSVSSSRNYGILERSRSIIRRRKKRHSMAKTLADIFSNIEILNHKGDLDKGVNNLVIDSRRVVPGSVYFALPGLRSDGRFFIDEAIDRGAIAVVSAENRQFVPPKVTFIHVEHPRKVLAEVSRRFYDEPDSNLDLIGITGTNGKTTVSYLVKHFLSGGEDPVGMLGTIQYDLGSRTVPAFRTTPESLDIYGMFAQMSSAGCRRAVMEVSSHGIDQFRVHEMAFDVSVFLNLTRDHLDYHHSMDEYFDAKARLFTGETGAIPKVSVVNVDDEYGRRLLGMVPTESRLIKFGLLPDADIRAEDVELGFSETTFRVIWPDGEGLIKTSLIGRYNVSNILAALSVCYGMGMDLNDVLKRVESFMGVPGRMERVEGMEGVNILVDYAHTDDALVNALEMLRGITPGRLLVVFGCGGDRDKTKRPAMTAAVQAKADFAWATADNPRKESQSQIFEDMREGISKPECIDFVENRRRSISLALDEAKEGDSVLIAGKGHESFQEFGDTVIPFDDRQVARELIAVKNIKSEV